MPFPWWIPGALQIGAGLFFGGEDDYVQDAQKELLRYGREGYSPETMGRMKRDVRTGIGQQSEALRVSRAQQLGRRNAPVQVEEGILSKIRQQGLGALAKGLTEVERGNEMAKLQALRGVVGSQRPPGSSGLIGQGLGQWSNYLMLSQLFGGGSSNYRKRMPQSVN